MDAAEDRGKVFRAPHQDSKEDAESGTSSAGRQQLFFRDAPIFHAIEDHQCRHHGARREHCGAAAREDVPVEELEMVETEVERRSCEVVEDELVLVRLLVVALDGGVAEDPVVGRRAGEPGGGGEGNLRPTSLKMLSVFPLYLKVLV